MQQPKTYSVDEATRLLENYCVYRERCHKEIEQKLYDLKMIPEAKEKILLHLMQHNFLNEERFAKAFVRGKFNIKKWGKIKITNELKFRNISAYNIKSALKEIDQNDYLTSLQQLADKKLPLIKESNSYKKSQKLSTYLISKGYENNLVYEIVKNCVKY
ncbi:RecX family transcriptional regulator [Lutibacter sp. HS1-25]|uniref:regulatory protein RecX n=1 Tax=Lutibacter sp. HS1-25 TaxID=2485000 RepID=UPI0010108861|nr:regulatory protein RecX [Lutibacter sp. HS1-25]RXP44494.1 RecX family transcriptional regulator [Lutibacter sp. HS1-25]